MRKLATVRQVGFLRPIMGADRIEVARIDGWDVIVKKDDFKVGDPCVFFEIDSMLPLEDERFAFLSNKKQNKVVDGVEYFRLKTMKMRNTISQGLALPLADFYGDFVKAGEEYYQNDEESDISEDVCLDKQLGIIKYEEPESFPRNKGGANRTKVSSSPAFIRKTDQDRVQNVFKNRHIFGNKLFVPTLKMDGSSTTMFFTEDENYIPTLQETYQHGEDYDATLEVVEYKPDDYFYLCSRNMLLEGDDSLWHQAVARQGLKEKCADLHRLTGRNLALQGELVAPSIQQGHEGVEEPTIFVFSIYDVDKGDYMPYSEALELMTKLDILRVPVLGEPMVLNEVFETVDDYVDYANNIQPIYAAVPEGVVFHSLEGGYSFKSISPKYLLKKG